MPPVTTSQQAQQNLQQFGSSMKSPDMALQDAQAATGVSQAQQQVSGLRGAIQNSTNLLDRVAPSVMGRTQNSLVTSAQADKQISNEQAPINTQLNKEQVDYTNANQDYNNAEQQAQARASGVVTGQQNQLSYLQSVYNNLKSSEDTAAAQQAARDAAAQQQRQFDAGQALAREQSAASLAASRASAPQLVGGNSTQGFSPAAGFKLSTNSVGGLSFTGPNGKPITAGQYVASGGGGVAQLVQVLSQSKDKGDQQILQALNSGVPIATLKAKYPYVFGGV